MMTETIEQLKQKVLAGGEITRAEAMELIQIEDRSEIECLLEAAGAINRHFNGNQPSLCSLVNAKSYLCGEDCAFCSQSTRFKTEATRYKLMSPEEILKVAKEFEASGVKNFCVVTSGGELSDQEFEQMLDTVRMLKRETTLEVDGSLGFLSPEKAERLKEAGIRRFNSNLQTSREYYAKIVTTHTYDTRLETLEALQRHDIGVCSGGLFGMGESREDRVGLAFELKPFQPECLPLNILNARPGTPLENQPKEDPWEMLKTVAVFRFVHPKSNIKLAGGREVNLGDDHQHRALRGGANGMIIGGYLTTGGNPIQTDVQLLKKAGFDVSAFEQACGCGKSPAACC